MADPVAVTSEVTFESSEKERVLETIQAIANAPVVRTATMDSTAPTLVAEETITPSTPIPTTTPDRTPLTLSSMPPELLIKIIGHLPSSTSFLSLLQTSHGLRLFITQNAAQISTAHIQTHYSSEIKLLRTTNVEGWLVPSLPCIAAEELSLLTQRRKTCTQCRRNLLPQTRMACQHHPSLQNSLSTPGPQFLHFLETHAPSISYQYQHSNAQTLESEAAAFDQRVGMYCVRGFVKKLDEAGEAPGFVEWEREREKGTRKVGEIVSEVLTHLKGVKDKGIKALKGCFGRRRKLLFGEVLDEKPSPRKKVNQLKVRMLWYFGETGVLNCPLVEEERLGKGKKEVTQEDTKHKLVEMKDDICAALLVGTGRAMAQFRCFSSFETLD